MLKLAGMMLYSGLTIYHTEHWFTFILHVLAGETVLLHQAGHTPVSNDSNSSMDGKYYYTFTVTLWHIGK